jgi:hypothetical protein
VVTPACYGDSRSIQTVGGAFDPQTFGAFYTCGAQPQWTFEVQTADTWSRTSLGVWEVGINTDGNLNGPCGGSNFIARIQQNPTPAGAASNNFATAVGPPDSGCNPIVPSGQKPPAFTISGNSVSLTFPASDLGNPTSLVWNGVIQSFAQTQSQTCTSPCGDVVPSTTSLDSSLIQGAVAESVPPVPPVQPPSTCNTGASGSEVATVSNPNQTAAANSAEAASILQSDGGAFTDVRDYGEGIISFVGDPTAAQSLLTSPPVPFSPFSSVSIAPGQTFTPLATLTTPPNDPGYGSQWNLATIGAPGAWAVTTGSGVVVADIDTGVDSTQPDLAANLTPGWDESSTTTLPSGVVDVGAPLGPGNTDTEQIAPGHGTAVAGVIAAVTNNGIGLASLGFNTKVEPVKVNFDDTAHVSAEIASGIRWAADHGAKILNLSFGSPCQDSNLALAINYAQQQGLLVVAAAGNGALNSNLDTNNGTNNAPSYPAAYSTAGGPGAPVIAVGATGPDGHGGQIRAAYSNTGNYVSMVAPGGNNDGNPADDLPVLATRDTCPAPPCYTTASGTSLAAAQASAAAALIWSNSTLTASQVGELVKSTTSDLGVSGTDVEYGTGMLNASVALADTPSSAAGYGTFASLPPVRILDTRFGTGAPQAPIGPGGTLPLTVTGVGGVMPGVTAVVLNVTVTRETAPGFLTVWPAGQTRPTASNINFGPNETIPNLVTVRVGANGKVDFFNSAGFVDVFADVAGYYTDGRTAGSTFVAVPPTRILDTHSNGGPILAGTSRLLPITGGLVPVQVPNDATGIVVNVTVVGPTAPGFLTVYPADQPLPLSSNLNFSAKETIPNLVSVRLGKVGAGPIEGIKLFNSAGFVRAIVDLEGYFTCAPWPACQQTGDTAGSRFFPLVAHRILDTRINVGGFSSPIGNAQSIVAHIVGQGGVLDTAAGVVMNTTVTQSTLGGYLTVYPSDLPSVPLSSNLNFTPGETIANLVTAKVPTTGAATGEDSFFNDAGTVQAIADVAGWYGAAGT